MYVDLAGVEVRCRVLVGWFEATVLLVNKCIKQLLEHL